jgi:hypothetical protein
MKDSWVKRLQSMGRRVYSQGRQDGLIEFVFKNIGTTNKCCVEFGFNSESLKGGSGSNVARLVLEDGWKQILFDGDYENLEINLHKEYLTPDSLKSVFEKYNVQKECDYVSIDVDSIDLWLFKSLLSNGYRPRLISVEYNYNFPIDVSATVIPGTIWQPKDAVYGASLLALNFVATEFEYHLICVENCLDLFFVRGDLISKTEVPPLSDFSVFTGLRAHCKPSSERIKLFAEYPSMNLLVNDSKKLKNLM